MVNMAHYQVRVAWGVARPVAPAALCLRDFCDVPTLKQGNLNETQHKAKH